MLLVGVLGSDYTGCMGDVGGVESEHRGLENIWANL